jgi:maltose O-acetyltransferase
MDECAFCEFALKDGDDVHYREAHKELLTPESLYVDEDYQKMMNGELYFAFGKELFEQRQRCKQILQRFNSLTNSPSKRMSALKILFGSIGKDCFIEPDFFADYGCNIHLGDKVYMNTGCVILDCAKVVLGNQVLMGPGVHIYAATHPTDPQLRLQELELGKPITIGDNAWIGGRSVICPGVSIGKNSVIGAGSVVVKDIPDNVVAVGNPCRIVKNV